MNIFGKQVHLWYPSRRRKCLKEHIKVVEKFSEVLIRDEERFYKTAVVWVLRQVLKFNKNIVIDF